MKMKKYACIHCEKVSTREEWNRETQLSFKTTIVPIDKGTDEKNRDEYGYSCPKCYEYQDAYMINIIQ